MDEPAESDTSAPSKGIVDISPPDKVPSPPTSRPTIVGHGPLLKKDPMVQPDKPDLAADVVENADKPEPSKTDRLLAMVTRGKVIEPPAGAEAPKEKEAEPEPDLSASPSATPKSEESEAVKKQSQIEVEAKRQASIDRLVASKQYFLKLSQGKSKSSKATLPLIIMALIVVTGVVIVIMKML